jgi:muramidase (phage lysozyme)
MRRIDAYVILGLKGKRKLKEEDEKNALKNKRKVRESILESRRKFNPISLFQNTLPRTGLLETIKNFILYTAMGTMVPFVMKNLPTILNASKKFIPIYKFTENFFGNVLNGMVNAIDFGYRVHDKVRKILKDVTGNKFEKTFDELSQTLNTFLSLATIAGLTIAGSGAGKIFQGPKTSPKPKPKPSSNWFGKIANKIKIPKILPFVGRFGKILGRVPIIGGLINFALSIAMGEKIGKAAARTVGSMLGAALGSFIPIPFAGTILGGILGDIVGGALYDTLENFGRPKKMASGGTIGKKTTKIPRTIKAKQIQKPTKQITQKTIPGKSIGGKEKIVKLFPESEDQNTMSPLRVLTKNSAIMKGGGVLGKFLSSGLELMALGQNIEKSTLLNLQNYLAYAIDSSIQESSNVNSKRIAGTMLAMAEGGSVPVTRSITEKGPSPGTRVAKDIVGSFTAMMGTKSSEILNNIRKEIDLFKMNIAPEGGGGPTIEGMSGFGSPEEQALLKAIRFAEGTTSSYGVIFGGKIIQELADGKMTVKEVIEMGNTRRLPSKFGGRDAGYGSGSSATGAYQFMPYTLTNMVNNGSLNENDLFTPELQDKAALILAKNRGVTLEDLKREGLSANIAAKLAPEWASFPTTTGSSYYGQPVKGLSELQGIYKQSLQTPNIGSKELLSPIATGQLYSTNTASNQYYGAPRPGGRQHAGVDLQMSPNSVQISFLGGVVQHIDRHTNSNGQDIGYGLFVDILTPTGMIERLAELGTLDPAIRIGSKVKPGQIVSRGWGFSGVTHLEYRKPGTSGISGTVDPLNYLRKLGVIQGGDTFVFKGGQQKDYNTVLKKPQQISSNQSISPSIQYISSNKTYTDSPTHTQILLQPILT